MLSLRHLTLRYGTHTVFEDLSLHVRRGEMLCVCGESGCGKSSLLRAVLGFTPAEGEIVVDGQPMDALHVDAIRRLTAYVPQELALPCDTVREMVNMPFDLRANRGSVRPEQQLLDDWTSLGLDARLMEKRVGELSGGQRQRIMLSVAGCLGKSLLIADEPTSALDEDSARLVLNYFQRLATERNMAVLVASHSPLFRALPNTIVL